MRKLIQLGLVLILGVLLTAYYGPAIPIGAAPCIDSGELPFRYSTTDIDYLDADPCIIAYYSFAQGGVRLVWDGIVVHRGGTVVHLVSFTSLAGSTAHQIPSREVESLSRLLGSAQWRLVTKSRYGTTTSTPYRSLETIVGGGKTVVIQDSNMTPVVVNQVRGTLQQLLEKVR